MSFFWKKQKKNIDEAAVDTLTALFQLCAMDSRDCAHLCIDAQEVYARGQESATRRINNVIAPSFRAAGMPNYWIHFSPVNFTDADGMPVAEYRFSGVTPLPGEPVIAKSHLSAFEGSDIDDRLKEAGTRLVVLTGFVFDCCVRATAISARRKNYHTVLFNDCTDYRQNITSEQLKKMGVIITNSNTFFTTLNRAATSPANDRNAPPKRHRL